MSVLSVNRKIVGSHSFGKVIKFRKQEDKFHSGKTNKAQFRENIEKLRSGPANEEEVKSFETKLLKDIKNIKSTSVKDLVKQIADRSEAIDKAEGEYDKANKAYKTVSYFESKKVENKKSAVRVMSLQARIIEEHTAFLAAVETHLSSLSTTEAAKLLDTLRNGFLGSDKGLLKAIKTTTPKWWSRKSQSKTKNIDKALDSRITKVTKDVTAENVALRKATNKYKDNPSLISTDSKAELRQLVRNVIEKYNFAAVSLGSDFDNKLLETCRKEIHEAGLLIDEGDVFKELRETNIKFETSKARYLNVSIHLDLENMVSGSEPINFNLMGRGITTKDHLKEAVPKVFGILGYEQSQVTAAILTIDSHNGNKSVPELAREILENPLKEMLAESKKQKNRIQEIEASAESRKELFIVGNGGPLL
jgi:hypothetical protein